MRLELVVFGDLLMLSDLSLFRPVAKHSRTETRGPEANYIAHRDHSKATG